MKVGEKIRRLRTLKGYSQENMADLLGISSVAYGDIERNKTDVSHSRLEKIAEALDIDLIALLTYGEQLANIFSNSSNSGVIGSGNVICDEKELRHKIEKALLENQNLTLRIEKLEMENAYLKEKLGKHE